METMSSLMKHVKRELGIMAWSLPMDDEELIEIIKDEVLKPFSVFYPREIPVNIDLNNTGYSQVTSTYDFDLDLILPADAELIAVKKLNNSDYLNRGIPSFIHQFNGNMMDMIDYQVTNNLYATIDSPAPTFEFKAPNRLILHNVYPLYTNSIEVVLFITHTQIETLPLTVMRFFKKLTVITVQKYLYKILERMDKIDTIYGTIDLRIDSWADAENKVEELMSTLEEEQILLPQYDKIFFVK